LPEWRVAQFFFPTLRLSVCRLELASSIVKKKKEKKSAVLKGEISSRPSPYAIKLFEAVIYGQVGKDYSREPLSKIRLG
jgi:hypothetical protein